MPIEFPCPTCHQLVRTPDGTAGKKGKCPQCGAVVQIPLMSAAGKVAESSAPGSRTPPSSLAPPAPMQAPRGAAGTIDFYCTACGQLVRAPAAMAGRRGRCQQCQAVVQIPQESQGPGTRGQEPGVRSQGSAAKTPGTSADTVEDLATLTPISGGLTPLPPAPPRQGGPLMTPPALGSGLTPISPLRPLAPDPLLGLPTVPIDALESMSRTVLSSPFAEGPIEHAPRPRPIVDDRGRGGLPWEQCPSMDAFGDTILGVVSAPQDAFSRMRRFGGIGNPMGFLVACHVLGRFLLWIETAVIGIGWLFLYRGGADWEMFLIGHGLIGLAGLVESVIRGTVGGLFLAVILHLTLLVFRAANGGFEATYRIVAFGCGSCYMLLPIPIVGPFFALVMQPIVLIYGIMYAHETSGWRAVAAVFLPGILLLTCCVGVVILFLVPALAQYIPTQAQ